MGVVNKLTNHTHNNKMEDGQSQEEENPLCVDMIHRLHDLIDI